MLFFLGDQKTRSLAIFCKVKAQKWGAPLSKRAQATPYATQAGPACFTRGASHVLEFSGLIFHTMIKLFTTTKEPQGVTKQCAEHSHEPLDQKLDKAQQQCHTQGRFFHGVHLSSIGVTCTAHTIGHCSTIRSKGSCVP